MPESRIFSLRLLFLYCYGKFCALLAALDGNRCFAFLLCFDNAKFIYGSHAALRTLIRHGIGCLARHRLNRHGISLALLQSLLCRLELELRVLYSFL